MTVKLPKNLNQEAACASVGPVYPSGVAPTGPENSPVRRIWVEDLRAEEGAQATQGSATTEGGASSRRLQYALWTQDARSWNKVVPLGSDFDDNKNVRSMAVSFDGQRQFYMVNQDYYYRSTDGGATATRSNVYSNKRYVQVACDRDCQTVLMLVREGSDYRIWRSTDGGDNWAGLSTVPFKYDTTDLVGSYDGSKWVATDYYTGNASMS